MIRFGDGQSTFVCVLCFGGFMNTDTKKHIWSSILKWIIIFGLLVFVYVKNQTLVQDAFREIQVTPAWKLVVCLLLANLYFVAEGLIISVMTKTCDNRLSIGRGIICAYMCTFYRIATLGSANGIAQLYYYNLHGIRVSTATGMAISQYTFQKITIGVMGTVSFVMLLLGGHAGIREYAWYMLAGAVVISLVCLFLFILTVSKRFSDFVMMLGRKIIKEKSRLYKQLDKAQTSIDYLQEQGRLVWKDKGLFLTVVLLNLFKFSCWYAIPGIFFAGDYAASVLTCLGLMAICNMLGCVMLAPSGVGTLDFVFAIFFSSIIPDGEAVTAALVVYRLFTWMIPFLIGIVPALVVKRK